MKDYTISGYLVMYTKQLRIDQMRWDKTEVIDIFENEQEAKRFFNLIYDTEELLPQDYPFRIEDALAYSSKHRIAQYSNIEPKIDIADDTGEDLYIIDNKIYLLVNTDDVEIYE